MPKTPGGSDKKKDTQNSKQPLKSPRNTPSAKSPKFGTATATKKAQDRPTSSSRHGSAEKVTSSGRNDEMMANKGGESSGRETEASDTATNRVTAADEGAEGVDAASQLSQYRVRLAMDLQKHGMTARGKIGDKAPLMGRITPIKEEVSSPALSMSSPGPASTGTNISVESAATVRAAVTPGHAASTPSYPFPRTSKTIPINTGMASVFAEASRGHSSTASDPSSPVISFSPGNAGRNNSFDVPIDSEYPAPNLYDLSLMLTAEPGMEAWWSTVVQIMTSCYKAERLSLSVPADSTDLENVPWGQKATYDASQEDETSLEHLRQGGSLFRSSLGTASEFSAMEDIPQPTPTARPSMQSRHSYTAFELGARRQTSDTVPSPTTATRPKVGVRSKTNYASTKPTEEATEVRTPGLELNRQTLRAHDVEDEAKSNEDEEPAAFTKRSYGRVLPMLQALEYEADPLIDNQGVSRVLERGRVIALTRGYPYLEKETSHTSSQTEASTHASTTAEPRKRPKKTRTETSANLSSILSTASRTAKGVDTAHEFAKRPTSSLDQLLEEGEPRRPPTPTYEEVEQAPPSPWSQSPAPSPAVRSETGENPFFVDAMVDEDSFNPVDTDTPRDYANMGVQEAIGMDNSWTILHIPLKHIVLPTKTRDFRLDASILDQKTHRDGKDKQPRPSSSEGAGASRLGPIAILSVLAPVIPYPSSLRQSLDHLSPHLATSFSLAQHYTNLEAEVARVYKHREQMTGFGGIDTDGRQLRAGIIGGPIDALRTLSFADSVMSASDVSGASRSLLGTPGGSTSSYKTQLPSSKQSNTDTYFSTEAKTEARRALSRTESARSAIRLGQTAMAARQASSGSVARTTGPSEASPPLVGSPQMGREEPSMGQESTLTRTSKTSKEFGPATSGSSDEAAAAANLTRAEPKHTKLHTGGADFASTFQALPAASVVAPGSRRSSTMPDELEMAAPSNRLKSLILDSMPVHIFVASPQNGSIVWVNSRYLTYRGQSAGQLASDPWASIHPDDRGSYLAEYAQCVKSGDAFARKVRIRRFDGAYRMFFARAVATRDKSNAIVHILGSYMDIHDQHILELEAHLRQELEVSEAKHRMLANLIPQIIFTASEDEGINFANDQWLSYTGKDLEASMGLGFLDFVHPDDLAKCQIPRGLSVAALRALARQQIAGGTFEDVAASAGRPTDPTYSNLVQLAKSGVVKIATDSSGRPTFSAEIRLRAKDGTYRWHLVRCVGFDNISIGGGESSYFGSATDIDDLKLLESQLKVAMESKSRFLSNMSHEIRTPLIGISGMVSFLQDTVLNEEQRDFTNTIQTSAKSLLFVINDILDLSKVDAGMMKLNFEWFHVRTLVEDVNELVSTLAIPKGLELNYLIDEDVPFWIKGDRVRIRQILLNIIGNAIKFTSKGEVFSRCRVRESGAVAAADANDIMLEFSVIDTGRGFSQDEARLMFKPFSQIDGSSTRQHGGSGLGLVISKQLVELHGGNMSGSAVPNKGAVFTFTAKFGLPTQDDHPSAAPPASAATKAPLTHAEVPLPAKPAAGPVMRIMGNTPSESPGPIETPPQIDSTGSSQPSIASVDTRATQRSSMSSVNTNLARFHEELRSNSQDSFRTRLDLPSSRHSSATKTPTQESSSDVTTPKDAIGVYRPPMFSVLVISPQQHSREATVKHVEMTLPKGIPSQITALASAAEATTLISNKDKDIEVIFTHVVVNLSSLDEIVALMGTIVASKMGQDTKVIILSDTVQRQAILRKVAGTPLEDAFSESTPAGKVTVVYKPVKLSRFAAIFDPSTASSSDMGLDRTRSTARRVLETQKQSYVNIEKKVAGKGYKVLLVEDNLVNQKVLKKYLGKAGLEHEVVGDGVEAVDAVIGRGRGAFQLILCDLHMPRKDGYQACREIRAWEKEHKYPAMPIIALSANVMSDVQAKCVEAGFSDYITKPVDFVDLGAVLSKFFEGPE